MKRSNNTNPGCTYWLCKLGLHWYDVSNYNTSLKTERKCIKCGKTQHQVPCGSMCIKWVDGLKSPRPFGHPCGQK